MAVIDSLKLNDGTILYPKTLTSAIYNDSGTERLDNVLAKSIYAVDEIPSSPLPRDADTLNGYSYAHFAEKNQTDVRLSAIEQASLEYGSRYIKAMSFNVGAFYDGSTAVPNALVAERSILHRKLFGKHDCDIIGGQEMGEFYNVGNTIPSLPLVLEHKYSHSTKHLRYGTVIASKLPLQDSIASVFPNSLYNYVKSYINFGNKRVCVINAHLAIEVNPAVARASQINTLLALMSEENYVVLLGDFNVYSKSEFDVFVTNGYKLCNGGDFGWFETWHNLGRPDGGWTNRAIDNIIVSPNIKIQNVEIDVNTISDHSPLIAELQIN